MMEKTLEDDDLDEQVLIRSILLQKRNHHSMSIITIPPRGCVHVKTTPQLALMKPWKFLSTE